MHRRAGMVYAVAYTGLLFVLSCTIFIEVIPQPMRVLLSLFACAIPSAVCPFFFTAAHTKIGYLKGFLVLLSTLALAQAFGFAAYLWRTDAIQHGDWESFYFFAAYLKASLIVAIVFYTLGYLTSRWLVKAWSRFARRDQSVTSSSESGLTDVCDAKNGPSP